MRYSVVPSISDAINRKSMRMDTGCLYNSMKNNFTDGMPQLISHDRHRLIGWATPAAVYMEPGLNRVLAHLHEAESIEDIEALRPMWKDFIARTIHGVPEESIEALKTRLGASVLSGSEIPWNTGVHALRGKGLAERAFPALFQKSDKDGLVPFDELEMIRPGVFQIGDLCVFAHQYMRRAESPLNNYNEELLNTLNQISQDPDVHVRVRLDPDMVGLASSSLHTVELDYWYGPKFSDDLSSIQAGVTTHGATDDQRMFHQISRMEFWWQKRTKGKDTELILEAEELRDSKSGADQSKLRCRYVHSVVDEATQRIEHLDGSIRAYTQEEMLSRMDVDLKRAGRHTEYTKLWRMDGKIELGRWKNAIHNHFRDNTLVGEYFGTFKSDAEVRAELAKFDVFPRSLQLDPRAVWQCPDANAFRVLITHQPSALESMPNIPLAVPYSSVEAGGERYGLFDLRALELKKVLKQRGQELAFVPNARFLQFEDDYVQFPLLLHRTPEEVEHTVEAFRSLLTKMAETKPYSPVLLNISTVSAELTFSVSLFGRCSDVLSWLNRPDPIPTFDNGGEWVRDAAKDMGQFREGVDYRLQYVQRESLNLHPRRTIVNEADARKVMAEMTEAEVPAAETDLVIRTASKVASASCGICEKDYLKCDCSYVMQDGQAPTTDLRFGFHYWAPGSVETLPAPVEEVVAANAPSKPRIVEQSDFRLENDLRDGPAEEIAD